MRIYIYITFFAHIEFYTRSFAEDCVLKVVIKGTPIYITENEVDSDLLNYGFNVKIAKHLRNSTKPNTICLVIISKNPKATEIFKLDNLFYLQVKIETFKKSSLAQYFACQRFLHCSINCGFSPRCVKYSGKHMAKELPPRHRPAVIVVMRTPLISVVARTTYMFYLLL